MRLRTLLLCITLLILPIVAQENQHSQAPVQVFSIDVKDMDIRDVIRLISKGYHLNIVLERTVSGKVTVHLEDVEVKEGLTALSQSYGWELTQKNNVYYIGVPEVKSHSEIMVKDGLVTAAILNQDITSFIQEFSEKTGVSIVPENHLKGRVTGKLFRVPVKDAIETLLEGNGFDVSFVKNIYRVVYGSKSQEGQKNNQPSRGRQQFRIDLEEGNLLTIDVQNGDLNALVNEIARKSEGEIIIYGKLSGQVNARLNRVPLEEALALILGGTKYTFINRNGILLLGDRNAATPSGKALAKSELVHLFHIKADEVPKLLPKNIASTSIKVVKEQNAILISGTSEDIANTREFLRTIDMAPPQVALDVLIVEYSREIGKDIGFEMSSGSGQAGSNYSSFPHLQMNTSGDKAKDLLRAVFGNKSFITSLPNDFQMTLKLLEDQKRAKVLAQPSLTVLNGNKASIDVGNTSYYKIIGGTADAPTENFRPIKSGITVNIVPWISKSGQITAEVNPEISNATGINSDGYPDISRRSINTTVRVDAGKTVVLGGLLISEETKTTEQVPFFGDLPIFGWLFKRQQKRQVQRNLVIYITPHIIDGEDFVDIPTELIRLGQENGKLWLKDMDETIIDYYGGPPEPNDSVAIETAGDVMLVDDVPEEKLSRKERKALEKAEKAPVEEETQE